ncbi:cytoskeleton-associated protein 2 [Embiotoca jacksoni]|uniref:cytoskeleton-associated protein 2 n=1 Tax=Embiotoca jacksoni TaxID=100190 RepID=UPI00370427CE
MDNVVVSRGNHTNKKRNKENTQPAHESKPFPKTSVVPLQLKSNEKLETQAKKGPVQRDGKGTAATNVKQRQTSRKAVLAEKPVMHKKIVAETPNPPTAVPSSKSAPGMYKGKIIQSKIGSIWKSSAAVCPADPKPLAPKTENQRNGDVTKSRSKSASAVPGRGNLQSAPMRSESGFNRPARALKPAASRRPPTGFCSTRPPTRTVPATLNSTSSRNTTVAPTKLSGTHSSKPKVPGTDIKVKKPCVPSTLSQYRFTVETAEERRAKLSEWMASKGKMFKRPAMTTAVPSKSKVSAKPGADLKPQSRSDVDPRPPSPLTKPVEAQKPVAAAGDCADDQRADLTANSQSPVIMNTTLHLLDNSDGDLLFDPQDRVDDIVVNLCDALEAMATPSRCSHELTQVTDEFQDVEMKGSEPVDECKNEEGKNEIPEDVYEQVKDEVEDNKDQKVEIEEVESGDDDEGMMEDASVIKYSVKTTPYLQSVRRTIEDEACTSTSRRKSNIKDLKFLTPVRRSCRIQRASSHLPKMLVDHDPCVSSLAELVKLDDDANAYIYRKNTALLQDLPDQPRL